MTHVLPILAALRENCRITNTALAQRIGWPVTTTNERVKHCIATRVTRCTALLNFDALELMHHTLWIITPEPHARDAWRRRVATLSAVNTLSRLPSGTYLVETVARDAIEQARLRKALMRDTRHVHAHAVRQEIVREGILCAARFPAEHNTTGNPPAATKILP